MTHQKGEPNWPWRLNVNKRLQAFKIWDTRVSRLPPNYRHMGMPQDFRFSIDRRPGALLQQLGVGYAKALKPNRQAGTGNATLGNSPGPAPPKLSLYPADNYLVMSELYRANESEGLMGGMTLWDKSYLGQMADSTNPALDPRQYMKETMNQSMEYPGPYPWQPRTDDTVTARPARQCPLAPMASGPRDPISIWRAQDAANRARHQAVRLREQGLPRWCSI